MASEPMYFSANALPEQIADNHSEVRKTEVLTIMTLSGIMSVSDISNGDIYECYAFTSAA
jgi:hypothetical protein